MIHLKGFENKNTSRDTISIQSLCYYYIIFHALISDKKMAQPKSCVWSHAVCKPLMDKQCSIFYAKDLSIAQR